MTLFTSAGKGGWAVHPPQPAPRPAAEDVYRLTFGKHKGKRFDELPVDYTLWLCDFAPSPALRLLAKKALELDVVLDNPDPCDAGPPSGALASSVLPLLAFEFEQRIRTEFGLIDPGSAESFAIAKCRGVLREIVTEHTGRRFLAPGELEGGNP